MLETWQAGGSVSAELDPAPQQQPFFFMHIAKAAGSFINEALKAAFEDDFVAHCEAGNLSPLNRDDWQETRAWSGHVYLSNWLRIENRLNFTARKFTLLRDPWKHLASHIQWLDHYNLDDYQHEFRMLDAETRGVVIEVGDADIENAGDLDRLLTNLSDKGIQYFDNCQSRYFIVGMDRIQRMDPLHLGHRDLLVEVEKNFDLIGLDCRMQQFQSALSELVGKPIQFGEKPVNTAKSHRRIPIERDDIRRVLQKRILLDLWFYDRQLNMSW